MAEADGPQFDIVRYFPSPVGQLVDFAGGATLGARSISLCCPVRVGVASGVCAGNKILHSDVINCILLPVPKVKVEVWTGCWVIMNGKGPAVPNRGPATISATHDKMFLH